MTSVLILGLLIGLRHAIEADHVAAVATLSTRSGSLRGALRLGAVWGIGHTLTLLIVGTAFLYLDTIVPERLVQALEITVGIMLILLGMDVVRRMLKDHIHFHVHPHAGGVVHFHAHSHKGELEHNLSQHEHNHATEFPLRALIVGLVHGLAGSAALVLLTLQTIQSPLIGILYIVLFGVGSIIGMAAISLVIVIPFYYSGKGLTWVHNGLKSVAGTATIVIGALLIYQNSV